MMQEESEAMHVSLYFPGALSFFWDMAEDAFGEWGGLYLAGFVSFILLIVYLSYGYYRETWLYKRIMGDKAKPCLYDGRGNRIRNPDGTPIEPQEENAEPEAPKEGETPAGEQGEKTKQ